MAPTNDLCSSVVTIPAAGPFPHLTAVVPDITEATTSGDPVTPSCVGNLSRSIWYKFTPQASGLYTFSVAFDTATTVEDTAMAIYTSVGGCNGPFVEVACSDDAVDLDRRSAIDIELNAGTTYYIVIWKFLPDPPAVGMTAIQLRVGKPVAPANDICSGAEAIPPSGPFPYLTAVTDTYKATVVNDPPLPMCQPIVSRSVWYKFIPTATTSYTISSCAGTATTIYDTVMAIYSASDCNGLFTQVACNDSDDDCDADRAAITTVLTANTTYFIVVWEYDTDPAQAGKTLVQLKVSVPPPQLLPLTKLPNGNIRAQFSGVTGQPYTMQGSTNLTSWADLGAPASLGGNLFEYIDTNGLPKRFYRVKSP